MWKRWSHGINDFIWWYDSIIEGYLKVKSIIIFCFMNPSGDLVTLQKRTLKPQKAGVVGNVSTTTYNKV